MRIAVTYICTGKYEMFWDTFYKTCEEHFYPGYAKEYFVFTDSERIIHQKLENVRVYYQAKSGWPYDTLLRFNWFCTIQDHLSNFDYCYYMNANSVFLHDMDETNAPFPTAEKPLVLAIHTPYFDDYLGETFHPERNPLSTAYVPYGANCRAHMGGFFGGTSDQFIRMSCTLRDRIADDLSRGIIAVWHDQSHLIKYATEVSHYDLAKGVVCSEEYIENREICALMFPSKAKYGGNDNLRGVSLKTRIRHLPKKIYAKMLKIAKVCHADSIVHGLVNKMKGKK